MNLLKRRPQAKFDNISRQPTQACITEHMKTSTIVRRCEYDEEITNIC